MIGAMEGHGQQQLHVHVRVEDESFWATVDEFPGAFATGDTIDELRESLEEGIALVLARPGGEVPEVKLDGFHAQPVSTAATPELVCA